MPEQSDDASKATGEQDSTKQTRTEVPNGAPVAAANVEEKPELDDFGLPIRKKKPPPHLSDDESEAPQDERAGVTKEVGVQEGKDLRMQETTDKVKVTEEEISAVVSKDTPSTPNGEEKEGDTQDAPTSKATDTNTAPDSPTSARHSRKFSDNASFFPDSDSGPAAPAVSEYSHQSLAPQAPKADTIKEEDEWQTMPAYAPFDIYDDDNKLIAREHLEEDEEAATYGGLGGAGKGYTRVQIDEDAQSATSMDDNTAYLFTKTQTTDLQVDDEDARDPLAQLQATKDLLTEGQRIAYVGLARLAMMELVQEVNAIERTSKTKKQTEIAVEAMTMWSQKMMVRLYSHMEIDSSEQLMIEQLAEHGVQAGDLTPTLMTNSRVRNPAADPLDDPMAGPKPGSPRRSQSLKPQPTDIKVTPASPSPTGTSHLKSPASDLASPAFHTPLSSPLPPSDTPNNEEPPPPYHEHEADDSNGAQVTLELPTTKNIDIDLRWTVLCDLFLVLISDSIYDSRSRRLLEHVAKYLDVHWLEICRFEKRVIDALEMQEAANKEQWDEKEHIQNREKMARNRRLAMMGLATVGGGIVIGLSAGLLAPVIGAGLAAGFTTIGITGTSAVLTGTGAAAAITTTGLVAGGSIGGKAAHRRTGAVKTFEYRPLHNNKRVNLIVTVSGWMTGKVDDVRLPFSTVDPIMGDIYSVLWEPEMLRSMGDTINVLANEALTQGLQQILGSTILVALMASLQAPLVLTKLSYLIDNPWSVSVARADAAGLILADSLIERNLGVRPVTLVGFSLGARVIFGALKELAKKGAFGLVQNVYMFGSPVIASKDEYLRCKAIVSGRFVNGYATNDWILGYLFRATSGGIMRVAGLAPVDIPGIENYNVTEFVAGHMQYRNAIPRLLREVGWAIDSDEFTEIEDPDPENHEQRQRELINEIEEARRNLEKKPVKKKWGGMFGGGATKKKGEKKEWEMYDERAKEQIKTDKDGNPTEIPMVLFDIEAIQREVAELAADGVEIREIETTLPPMKIDTSKPAVEPVSTEDTTAEKPSLRETKSYNDSLPHGQANTHHTIAPQKADYGYDYDEFEPNEGDVSMTFDTSFTSSPKPEKAVAQESGVGSNAVSATGSTHSFGNGTNGHASGSEEQAQTRPPVKSANTMPVAAPIVDPRHNAWADEEDEFAEKEISLSFA